MRSKVRRASAREPGELTVAEEFAYLLRRRYIGVACRRLVRMTRRGFRVGARRIRKGTGRLLSTVLAYGRLLRLRLGGRRSRDAYVTLRGRLPTRQASADLVGTGMVYFVMAAAASGVVGNLAYDILKVATRRQMKRFQAGSFREALTSAVDRRRPPTDDDVRRHLDALVKTAVIEHCQRFRLGVPEFEDLRVDHWEYPQDEPLGPLDSHVSLLEPYTTRAVLRSRADASFGAVVFMPWTRAGAAHGLQVRVTYANPADDATGTGAGGG